MIYPQVNINGTSAEELIAQQVAVINAADALLSALRQAMPHGRDYQTHKDPTAYVLARGEAESRYYTAQKLKIEAENIAMHIQEQVRG